MSGHIQTVGRRRSESSVLGIKLRVVELNLLLVRRVSSEDLSFELMCVSVGKCLGCVALRDVIALFELVNAREWHYRAWPRRGFGLTEV